MKIRLSKIASLLGAELLGDDLDVSGIAGIEEARKGELTWVKDERMLSVAENAAASALIVPLSVSLSNKPVLKVSHPRLAFARVLKLFHPGKAFSPGIHPTAVMGRAVVIGEGAHVGPCAVLGDEVVVGRGAVIQAGVYLGDRVVVGEDAMIYPGVVIMDRITIGARTIIHSNSVIGADGFGYVKDGHRHVKIPQIGSVVIGDDVEIGACATIDRATTGNTLIGRGSKIDNLVQVAHNVQVGEDTIIISQSGIAGSTMIGDRVLIAAQAGVAQHLKVGSDTIVASRSGVDKDIAPGSMVSGYPIQNHRQELRFQAALRQVPKLLERVKRLEAILAETKEGTSAGDAPSRD